MALAVALPDVDRDGRRDIVIGNDYEGCPTLVYLNRPRHWKLHARKSSLHG